MQTGEEVNPFRHLEHNARQDPNGVFIESVSTTLLYSEALAYVQKIAFELRRFGIGPGSLVAVDLPTQLGLLFTEALFHEAVISCVLPRQYSQRADFTIDWLISGRPEEHKVSANFLQVDPAFLRQIESNPVGVRSRAYASAQDICRLVFSSGTTGRPKAVPLTYEMIEFRSRMAREVWMRDAPFMSLLDASTVSGFFTFYASVADGRPYLAPATMAENITLLKRHAIKSIKTSPTQVAELVRQLEATDDRLPSIRAAQIAGSVLPVTLARRLRARTSSEIFNMYGSTEVGTVSARYTDSDDPFDAGLPTSGSTLEIVDESDQPVPAGVRGRVRCKRPLMSTGYFHDPDASAASFRDGWFYPGDYGTIQPDGTLTLRGRESEFINAGGVKVDPVQLDLFAVSLPGVTDACAFGYLDSAGLQQVGLALVTRPDVNGNALAAALQQAFGSASPRTIVRVEEIPRNAMGKPLRRAFTELHSVAPSS